MNNSHFLIRVALGVALMTAVPPLSAWGQNDVHSLAAQGGVTTNPNTSAEDVATGANVFRRHCSTCHGRNAEGDRGPDLTRGTFRHAQTDSALFRIILQGIPGTSMAGVYLADSQVWQVLSYIRSLGGDSERIALSGDPAQGMKVFAEKGECATCHRVSGQGGRRGADLSTIGWARSPEHLRTALLDPSETVDSNFRLVQVILKNGDMIEGIFLNEDTYSVQLMNETEDLISISKAGVEEVLKPRMSLMPEYEDTFTSSELNDLVAYLYSLEGDMQDD